MRAGILARTMSNERLVHLLRLSRVLGVPGYWLRREAEEGRLPHLRAGRQYLFDEAVVREILLRRAGSAPGGDSTPHSTEEGARQ